MSEEKELEEFIEEQLRLHEAIMRKVKPYVEKWFREYGIEVNSNETRNTFLAMVLELTRSIFVNWSYKKRQEECRKKWVRK